MKRVTSAPFGSVEVLYCGLYERAKDGTYEPKGGEKDPYDILAILEQAEQGNESFISFILIDKIKTLQEDMGDNDVVAYWGEKAIVNPYFKIKRF